MCRPLSPPVSTDGTRRVPATSNLPGWSLGLAKVLTYVKRIVLEFIGGSWDGMNLCTFCPGRGGGGTGHPHLREDPARALRDEKSSCPPTTPYTTPAAAGSTWSYTVSRFSARSWSAWSVSRRCKRAAGRTA